MSDISVIVPVFHGKKFIDGIIFQIEECQRKLQHSRENKNIELLLVNDVQDESISERKSTLIDIVVYNAEKNRGIHGARVFGLNHSSGEYILFLDQDDKIKADYFVSQLAAIGNRDAVVCRLIHENKTFYNQDYPFEKMVDKEYMLDNGCLIISPGQVLIRKSAIPAVWKENIVKNNGADDFFLWLCMAKSGSTFALNYDILFEHVVNHENASGNSVAMTESEREIVRIIKEKHIYDQTDIIRLESMLKSTMMNRLRTLDKFHKMYYVLDKWMELKQQGKEIHSFLAKRGYHDIAVYGMNQLARRLIKELENSDEYVRYVIDRNSKDLVEDIPLCSPEEKFEKVDIIIVALVQREEEIKHLLGQKTDFPVMTISEIISQM